jgi:hypothetical protein
MKQKDMSFLLPLAALFISDLFIQGLYSIGEFDYPGIYSGQWKNYLILMTAVLIGWGLKGKKISRLFAGAFVAPTIFFLISNFMVWAASTEVMYPKSFGGLLLCYEAGLPFYKNALIATMLFLPVILIGYNYMTKKKAALTLA